MVAGDRGHVHTVNLSQCISQYVTHKQHRGILRSSSPSCFVSEGRAGMTGERGQRIDFGAKQHIYNTRLHNQMAKYNSNLSA